jgi:hypothetical protein
MSDLSLTFETVIHFLSSAQNDLTGHRIPIYLDAERVGMAYNPRPVDDSQLLPPDAPDHGDKMWKADASLRRECADYQNAYYCLSAACGRLWAVREPHIAIYCPSRLQDKSIRMISKKALDTSPGMG